MARENHEKRTDLYEKAKQTEPVFSQADFDDYDRNYVDNSPRASHDEDDFDDLIEDHKHQECAGCGRANDDYETFHPMVHNGQTTEPLCVGCRGAIARGEF